MGWIALALAVALAMRLFALWLAWGAWHRGDPAIYESLAGALGAGHGLALPAGGDGPLAPTAMYPPLLPLLLAGVGVLLPLNAATFCLVNSLVDGVAAFLLGRLAKQLGRPDLSLPVGLAYLVWPSIAFMAPLAYKEGLMIALLLAALVALLEQARSPGLRWAALSGLAAGALVLTQPAVAPMLPLSFLAVAPCFATRAGWLRASLVAAGVALLVLLPWWARNAILFGRFIPFTASGGLALWQGAHPAGGVVWHPPPAEWGARGEMAAADSARSAALRIIASDPWAYVARCLQKFPASFFRANWATDQLLFATGQPWPALARSALARIGPTVAELAVAVLALIGLVKSPRSFFARLLWVSLAQVVLFGIWFEYSERHRLFMTPFILLMAAALLASANRHSPDPA